ncbi:hypothetical protein PMAYCL1PPCAC_13021, partial [Pristionchus mayeri]
FSSWARSGPATIWNSANLALGFEQEGEGEILAVPSFLYLYNPANSQAYRSVLSSLIHGSSGCVTISDGITLNLMVSTLYGYGNIHIKMRTTEGFCQLLKTLEYAGGGAADAAPVAAQSYQSAATPMLSQQLQLMGPSSLQPMPLSLPQLNESQPNQLQGGSSMQFRRPLRVGGTSERRREETTGEEEREKRKMEGLANYMDGKRKRTIALERMTVERSQPPSRAVSTFTHPSTPFSPSAAAAFHSPADQEAGEHPDSSTSMPILTRAVDTSGSVIDLTSPPQSSKQPDWLQVLASLLPTPAPTPDPAPSSGGAWGAQSMGQPSFFPQSTAATPQTTFSLLNGGNSMGGSGSASSAAFGGLSGLQSGGNALMPFSSTSLNGLEVYRETARAFEEVANRVYRFPPVQRQRIIDSIESVLYLCGV